MRTGVDREKRAVRWQFLRLVLDGLVSALATGLAPARLDGVLDLVEDAVRAPEAHRSDNPSSVSAAPTRGDTA